MSRYSSSGLHRAEALFEGAHPRGAQYLDQAPVLALWVLPWVKVLEPSAQSFARTWVSHHCEAGVGLKDFLRAANFTAPMRALSAKALLAKQAALYQMMGRVAPAVLGRCVPETAKAQRVWLRALDEWLELSRRRVTYDRDAMALFTWCVERFASDPIATERIRDLADFHFSGPHFNYAWSMNRAIEEMDIWHARVTLESQIKGLPVGPDTPIDLSDAKPMEIDGYKIEPLHTPRQIAEEGSAMRHCVATYIKSVFDGRSHIASITKDGKRVATLDYGARFQLRGPRNSPTTPVVQSMAMLYAEVQKNRRPPPDRSEAPD